MTAIILISLPADHKRAGKVLDALVSERLDVRWFSAEPGTADWETAKDESDRARCVLFCWSDATRVDAAAPYRDLARTAIVAGTAIGIEIDRGALPPDLAMTSYGLHGWRRGDGRLHKGVSERAICGKGQDDIRQSPARRGKMDPSHPHRAFLPWGRRRGITIGRERRQGRHGQTDPGRGRENMQWFRRSSRFTPESVIGN